MNNKLLVLGIGNMLLTDDGVGVFASQELMKEHWPAQVTVREGGTFTQDIFYSFKGYSHLLVLDVVHCGGKPEISADACRGCHQCAKQCANNGIEFIGSKAHINNDNCVGCGRCIGACNFDAIYNPNDSTNDELNCKMAEYAKAAVNGRPAIYINIVNQVSPCCDCHAENDAAIIPDVGMFASLDPVALDNACADACNAMPIISNSRLGEKPHTHGDHFTDSYPETNWRSCLEHAEKIGLGQQAYELITF